MNTDIETLARLTGLPFIVGIKPFATLLIFGLMLRCDMIADPFFIQDRFLMFGNDVFLLIVFCFFIADTIADKVPLIDHFLDAFYFLIKPLAGAFLGFLIAGSVDIDKSLSWISLSFAIIGGGTISLVVHSTKTAIRLASTKLTGGIGNGVLSGVEDFGAAIGTVCILNYPHLTGFLILSVIVLFIFLLPKLYRHLRGLIKNISAFFKSWLGLEKVRHIP